MTAPHATRPARLRFAATTLAALTLATASGAFTAPDSRISSPTPVKNFSLPFFNHDGFHTMLIRGREALIANPARVELTDMTLSLYSGDATRAVDTVILAPAATVTPATRIVTGPDLIRLIRDDLELTGRDWTYTHDETRIVIRRQARIVFNASLENLLK